MLTHAQREEGTDAATGTDDLTPSPTPTPASALVGAGDGTTGADALFFKDLSPRSHSRARSDAGAIAGSKYELDVAVGVWCGAFHSVAVCR